MKLQKYLSAVLAALSAFSMTACNKVKNTEEKKYKKIYVRVPSADENVYPDIVRVKAVLAIYEDEYARDRAYLYSADDGKYHAYPAPVEITDGMRGALVRLCGAENVR